MGFSSEDIQLQFPVLELTEYRGDDIVALTLPMPALSAEIVEGWEIALETPMLTPDFAYIVWDINLTLPMASLSVNTASFDIALTLPAITPDVDIYEWNVATGDLSFPMPTPSISIVRAISINVDAPMLTPSISFGASNQIDIELSIPVPAIAAAIVQAYGIDSDKTVLAINAKTGAVALFSNFNFDTVTVYQGQLYGTTSDGLRKISGTKDDDDKIEASASFYATDCGNSFLKSVRKLILKGDDTGYDPSVTVTSGKKSFTGKAHFADDLGQQGVDVPGERSTSGDTFAVKVFSDRPLDVESIDLIFKKVR
jgi:hypothetical protein